MLTDAQKVDVRRYLGYELAGNTASASFVPTVFLAFPRIGPHPGMSLDYRLANLSAEEEAVLVNTFLTNLNTLETNVLQSNVDSKTAGTWSSNPKEISDRERLYNGWRRKMAAFIGCPPGPGLGLGGMTIVRA